MPSDELAPQQLSDAEFLDAVTQTLLGVANATFDARAPRSFAGDAWDVLAFLANSTADEVELLVTELQREREELKRTQEQLVQAEKLAALGRLAAGVAHELNQPLTVMRTMVDLVGLSPDERIGDHEADLSLMRDAMMHMSGIVDSIRTFGRGTRHVPREVPALEPLEAAIRLLGQELANAGIEVNWRVEAPLPAISMDSDRMRQVFINLIANARDAMLSGIGNGESDLARDTAEVALALDLRVRVEDSWLLFAVCDNGPGIAPDAAGRIFEPFFSTKGELQGTGLGLSVAHGIVTEHGGTIRYCELPGDEADSSWSCFELRIPLNTEVG